MVKKILKINDNIQLLYNFTIETFETKQLLLRLHVTLL